MMGKRVWVVCLLAILIVSSISINPLKMEERNQQPITSRIIIKFKEDINPHALPSLSFLNKIFGGRLSPLLTLEEDPQIFTLPNIYLLSFKDRVDIGRVAKVYKTILSEWVEYVEPDYPFFVFQDDEIEFKIPQSARISCQEAGEPTPSSFPNDPLFKYQWHLHGPDEGGIDVVRAWNISTGKGVVVAVLDTGVKWFEGDWGGHPYGPEDLSSEKLVDGYDFVYNQPYFFADQNGHGVHVAGTISQDTNNGIGVCGVAPDAKIMPVKVIDDKGIGYISAIVKGIYYATMKGANIISMSFGGRRSSECLEEALRYAYKRGVTLVAAAGNVGKFSRDRGIMYPAKYPFVISVGATTYEKELAPYSRYGPEIDVVAPGGDIHSDKNGDGYPDGILQEAHLPMYGVSGGATWGYYFFQGTSMACPHVAGVAALLYAMGFTDPKEIKDRICKTAIDLGTPGWDSLYGWGLINAYRAVEAPFEPEIAIPNEEKNVSLNITLKVYVRDPQGDKLTVKFYGRKLEDFEIREGGIYTREEIEKTRSRLIGIVKDIASDSWATIEWKNLSENSFYQWFVVVNDSKVEISSDKFIFKTTNVNDPPYVPSNPYPPDNSTGISTSVALAFDGGDPDDEDKVTYELWFGETKDPPYYGKIGSFPASQKRIVFEIHGLKENTTYYWRIKATDEKGLSREGKVWSFRTGSSFMIFNSPPYYPSDPYPPDGATNVSLVPVLRWKGGDPDEGDTVRYDVYFGKVSPPPKVSEGQLSTTYYPGVLEPGTVYYWRIVARDEEGKERSSPIWMFITQEEGTKTNILDVYVLPIGFGKVSISVINNGREKLRNISWKIQIGIGRNERFKTNSTGMIDEIEAWERRWITSENTLKGLGVIKVTVDIQVEGKIFEYKYKGFIIWKLIILREVS